MTDSTDPPRPDLTKGVSFSALADGGMLQGRVGDDEVLLARAGDSVFAVGAHCTHYRGQLADGLIVGGTVRCPLHHACFSLRTGEALRAPALDPIACWRVERRGDSVVVREKITASESKPAGAPAAKPSPTSVGIVGGGAAALAAADMLRREGYDGPIAMITADEDAPVDRPNLSKDYLAGEAQDDWIPLWASDQYAQKQIELILRRRVTSLDAAARAVVFEDGSRREFGAILLATGADPVHLPIPGADGDNVLYLRSFANSRALVERAQSAKHAVVAGASFIGLEVAASLRARGISVDVVAPDRVPLEKVVGNEVGQYVQSLHEGHGVVFHLGQTLTAVDGRTVTLSGGRTLDADFVVMGVGVRPATGLAEQAGLTMDRGISVNEYLETSAPGIFAAGDVARWPDPHTGGRIRVEHWVVAERQGQTAARNILGRRERFDAVPFFWSQHYDVTIRYVGHAEQWDAVSVDGAFASGCTVTYVRAGQNVAVATIGRDKKNLEAEVAMERTHG
ncbi:MAG TPA: FAD-dependent oxidoreductase [Vicinamibacterales bacterium]|nr:FAD-dependent oxidoreductase [Vicinamibacterales bacterium]